MNVPTVQNVQQPPFMMVPISMMMAPPMSGAAAAGAGAGANANAYPPPLEFRSNYYMNQYGYYPVQAQPQPQVYYPQVYMQRQPFALVDATTTPLVGPLFPDTATAPVGGRQAADSSSSSSLAAYLKSIEAKTLMPPQSLASAPSLATIANPMGPFGSFNPFPKFVGSVGSAGIGSTRSPANRASPLTSPLTSPLNSPAGIVVLETPSSSSSTRKIPEPIKIPTQNEQNDLELLKKLDRYAYTPLSPITPSLSPLPTMPLGPPLSSTIVKKYKIDSRNATGPQSVVNFKIPTVASDQLAPEPSEIFQFGQFGRPQNIQRFMQVVTTIQNEQNRDKYLHPSQINSLRTQYSKEHDNASIKNHLSALKKQYPYEQEKFLEVVFAKNLKSEFNKALNLKTLQQQKNRTHSIYSALVETSQAFKISPLTTLNLWSKYSLLPNIAELMPLYNELRINVFPNTIPLLKFETKVQQWFVDHGVKIFTENDIKRQGISPTPDLLFTNENIVFVNDVQVKWVDAKAFYGSDIDWVVSTIDEQYKKYRRHFGYGVFVFSLGYSTKLLNKIRELNPADKDSIVFLDYPTMRLYSNNNGKG